MAAQRPLVTVQSTSGKGAQIRVPAVLLSPIRTDVVREVHSNISKNDRTPYAVSPTAGEQTSAESWGTGRALSRAARVKGGGSSRSGQVAFANFARGGRMYAPTKVWRRWSRPVNQKQRRFAVCAALAASAVPALVMARGHRVSTVPELPLVIDDKDLQSITKTKDAEKLLTTFGVGDDLERVRQSRTIRAGAGKMRNRRYVQRRGPLLVHNDARQRDSQLVKAFRNVAGVDTCPVSALNLLSLAPGGHVGRFIVFTRSAFERLDSVFGTARRDSEQKTGFRPPRSSVTNADLQRIIRSDEVQAAIKPRAAKPRHQPRKKNPLKNSAAMAQLNPYAAVAKRRSVLQSQAGAEKRKANLQKRRKIAPNKKFVALLKE